MDKKLAALSVDNMRFDLAGVVRNVEQQRKLAAGKEMSKDAPRIVAEDLAVGEGAVHRRPRGDHHVLGEIGCDLMPEPARAAVNGDDDVTLLKAEGRGGRRIEISA